MPNDCNIKIIFYTFKGADPIQEIEIESIIKHPNYTRVTRSSPNNDIALIKLKEPALISQNNINTICLPIEPEDDIDLVQKRNKKRNMTISGFGSLGNGTGIKQPEILQKGFVPFVNHTQCEEIYNEFNITIHEGQFCAGGENLVDTCFGDSGKKF